jgi:hypothetical protein
VNSHGEGSFEQDNWHWDREDPMAVGRGIAWGLFLGSLMWAGIIGGVVYFIR